MRGILLPALVFALLWACGACCATVYVNRDYYYSDYDKQWHYNVVDRHYGGGVTWGQDTNFGMAGTGSPYVLEASVYVDGGATLTVEPGVTVNTPPGCGIYVSGTLDAQGTASQSITFTSTGGTSRGSWREIYFVGSGASSSVMRYCDVSYAGSAENVYLMDFWHYTHGIIGGVDTAPTFDNCTVAHGTHGFRFTGTSQPTITNCSISDCDYGIVFHESSYYPGYGASAPVDGNAITGCDAAAYCTMQATGAFGSANNFYANTHNCIRVSDGNVQNASSMRRLVGNPVWEIQAPVGILASTSLTIDPGCVVKLKSGVSVWNSGTLNASGAASDKIYFTSYLDDSVGGDTTPEDGTLPSAGNWADMLFINSGASGSLMNNCVLSYGGRVGDVYDGTYGWHNQRGNIVCWNSSPTIRNTISRNAQGDGAYLIGNSQPTFDNVLFDQNGAWAILCGNMEGNPVISNCSASGNGANATRVPSGTLSGSRTWYKSIPYWLDGYVWLAADAALTIQPGVAVKSPANVGFYIAGNLQAIGTSAEPIYFTSTKDDIYGDSNADGTASTPAPGDWGDLDFYAGAASLDYCVVRYGGVGGDDYSGEGNWHTRNGNIHIRNCSPAIRNSVIEKSLHYGVYGDYGCQVTLQNNVIRDNDWGIVIEQDGFYGDQAPRVTGNTFTGNNWVGWVSAQAMNMFAADNTVSGNVSNGLQIYSSTIQTSAQWRRMLGTSTLVVAGDIVVPPGAALNIAPKSVVKMKPDTSIRSRGTLTADGTSSNKIVFTSWKDDSVEGNTDAASATPAPADWLAIVFHGAASNASSMKNCEVRYGSRETNLYNEVGWLDYNGNVIIRDSNATLEDVVVKNGGRYGLVMLGNSKPTLTRVSMTDNGYYAGYLSITGNATITDCQASGNGANGIQMEPGWFDSEARTWYKSIPYVITGHTYVGANATLTVNPGAVVKFQPGTALFITGNLQAIAKSDQDKIHFTAFTDDAAGGDTDAQQVDPAPGYWKEVCFHGAAASSSALEGCTFRYAGNGLNEYVGPGWHTSVGDVSVFSASPTFKNCVFSNSGDAGVYLGDNAPCQIVNCDIHDNSRGIYTDEAYSAALDPAPIIGCQIHDNTSNAFDVTPNASVNIGGDNDVQDNTKNWANIRGGTMGVSGTWRYVSDGNCPFRLQENTLLFIGGGTSLGIEPGVVVKMGQSTGMCVNGGLNAVGSNEKRIYFTADTDDTLAGDSNGDGNATTPAGGFYKDVVFANSLPTSVAYCGFRYGGCGTGDSYEYGFWRNPVANVYVYDRALTFDHCDFAFAAYDGLVSHSGDLTLNNCTFANNGRLGLYTFYDSHCTLNSCVAYGNPHAATQTDGEQGGTITADYCDLVGINYRRVCLQDTNGYWYWDWRDINPAGTGNFAADPLFVNAAAGDFTLKAASPLINAGDPSKTDPNGTRLDVGAYPFDGLWNPISIAVAKTSPDGTPLLIAGVVATGGANELGGMIYVEDENRISGIRVDSAVASKAGDKVNVSGVLGKVDGERAIVSADVSVITGDFTQPTPFFTTGKNVGGGTVGYNPGVPGAGGVNNIGLLVVVTGKVVDPGSGFFYVDDGSGKLKVYSSASVTADQFVRVQGISSTELVGGALTPVIRTRTTADVN